MNRQLLTLSFTFLLEQNKDLIIRDLRTSSTSPNLFTVFVYGKNAKRKVLFRIKGIRVWYQSDLYVCNKHIISLLKQNPPDRLQCNRHQKRMPIIGTRLVREPYKSQSLEVENY